MQFYNLSEWILEKYGVCFPNRNIYFKITSSIPPEAYIFDAYQPYDYFLTNIIKRLYDNTKVTDLNITVSLRQMIEKDNIWRKLYYLTGKNFFFFFFHQCIIYFKWGKSTYIQLSGTDDDWSLQSQKILNNSCNNDCFSSLFEIGFNKNVEIKMHKMLYTTISYQRKKTIIYKKNAILTKNDILSQYVGLEISKKIAFRRIQMKSLKKLLHHSPTFGKCKSVYNEIIGSQVKIVPVEKVILFIIKIIELSVPYKILLKKSFMKIFLRNMKKVLKFNSKQKVTLGFIMNGIAEKQNPFIRNNLAKVIIWLIYTVVIKIMKSFFYVTMSDKGNSLVFIDQQFWKKYEKIALENMLIEKKIIQVHDEIPFNKVSKIKFFPKLNGSGCRAIVFKSIFNKTNSEHLELCNVFIKQLIAFNMKEYSSSPWKKLHSSWLNYTSKKNRSLPYYYAKIDIKDAYGSIIHEKLKYIIDKWCSGIEDNLKLVTFKVKCPRGKLLKQFINLPSSAEEKILIYEPGSEKSVSLLELKSIIFSYIDNTYVSFRDKTYRQIKGIPQGGKLSGALCEIYYNSFDCDYLSDIHSLSNGDVLLRAIDDYVCISSDYNRTKKFLDIMVRGIPEYGFEIQNEKTVTNLLDFTNGELRQHSNVVDYFGYTLDMDNGFITPDLSRFKNSDPRSNVVFSNLDKRVLFKKMSFVVTSKLNPLLFDSSYQTLRIMIWSIHCAACIMVQKYLAMIHFLQLARVELEPHYLLECIEKGSHTIAAFLSKKKYKSITYAVAKKVCFKSFILTLEGKEYYSEMVNHLQLLQSRLKISSKRIERIIKSVGKTSL